MFDVTSLAEHTSKIEKSNICTDVNGWHSIYKTCINETLSDKTELKDSKVDRNTNDEIIHNHCLLVLEST